MHLIYTRFFTKVMRDLGLVDFDEPMLSLRNQGIILGEDSEKMSKSRGMSSPRMNWSSVTGPIRSGPT